MIAEVYPPSFEGPRAVISWASTEPEGTWFQLYVAGRLAWYGTERHATIAIPRGLVDVRIGSVADGQQANDLSRSGYEALPFDVGGYDGSGWSVLATRATLAWTGFGATAYRIYEGGGGFDHGPYDVGGYDGSAGTLVGTVTALEQGYSTEGYDLGGYDSGGYDAQGGDFSWTSRPLARGDWNFAVVPVDAAGVEGTPSTSTVTITAPPRPPAPDGGGKRLTYAYDAGTRVATLNWLDSPG